MFTGIVERKGTVLEVARGATGARIRIDVGTLARMPEKGESVSVSGVCLTVVERRASAVTFDVVQESLSRTNLGSLRGGSEVNIETALRVGDPLGGHYVLGHVDGLGRVTRVEERGSGREIVVQPPRDLLPLVAEKGSVTLDGVSLTVARLAVDAFRVALIPTTLAVTTLGSLRVGSEANLEVDVLARYLARLLAERG